MGCDALLVNKTKNTYLHLGRYYHYKNAMEDILGQNTSKEILLNRLNALTAEAEDFDDLQMVSRLYRWVYVQPEGDVYVFTHDYVEQSDFNYENMTYVELPEDDTPENLLGEKVPCKVYNFTVNCVPSPVMYNSLEECIAEFVKTALSAHDPMTTGETIFFSEDESISCYELI